jgi:hypothetical protein
MKLHLTTNQVLIGLIFLDLLMVVLHVSIGRENYLFYLDAEQNIPTAYQAIKAIFMGTYFLTVKLQQMKQLFRFMGITLTGLGIDEWLFWHENVESLLEKVYLNETQQLVAALRDMGYHSSSWVILLTPVMLCWVAIFAYFFHRVSEYQRKVLSIFLSFFLIALVLELLGTRGMLSDMTYFWVATFEELAELLGVSSLSMLLGMNYPLLINKTSKTDD